jgi:hypothetical protein
LQAEKDLLFHPHPYRSVSALFADFNIPSPKGHWRLTDFLYGQINGLSFSRGFLTATNGVRCFILRLDGSLYDGHLQWFVVDEISSEETKRIANEPTLEELMELE